MDSNFADGSHFADDLLQVISRARTAVRDLLVGEDWSNADAIDAPPAPALSEWAEQLSFIPPEPVQQDFINRFGGVNEFGLYNFTGVAPIFQKIAIEGTGPVNLDRYTVHVTDPTLDGVRLNAADLLKIERANFPSLLDPAISSFEPYDKTRTSDLNFLDAKADPLLAALHINIPLHRPNLYIYDDGAVGVVLADEHRFRVATIWTARDHGHPVSGFREWGATDEAGGVTMYCRGVDQATGLLGAAAGERVFTPADLLWKSWQQGLVRLLTERGAQAAVGEVISTRYRWSSLKAIYYQPVGHWI